MAIVIAALLPVFLLIVLGFVLKRSLANARRELETAMRVN